MTTENNMWVSQDSWKLIENEMKNGYSPDISPANADDFFHFRKYRIRHISIEMISIESLIFGE